MCGAQYSPLEGWLLLRGPFKYRVCFSQIEKGLSNMWKSFYESLVEVDKPQEWLDFLFVWQSWPFWDSSYLCWVHFDWIVRNNLKDFHDLANNLPMFLQGFSEYGDFIQIYHYHPFRDQVFKYCVHQHLEGGWAVGQSEEHHKWLVEASVGPESCFPFVTIFHLDIVKSPTYIKLSEVLSSLQLIDEFRDEREQVLIFDGDHI